VRRLSVEARTVEWQNVEGQNVKGQNVVRHFGHSQTSRNIGSVLLFYEFMFIKVYTVLFPAHCGHHNDFVNTWAIFCYQFWGFRVNFDYAH
jgi:hypothetical protein